MFQNIDPAAILIPDINKKIISYLYCDNSELLNTLIRVNKVFARSIIQLALETETNDLDISRDEWQARLLRLSLLENDSKFLTMNILSRKTLPSKLRLEAINYFLNNHNKSTKKSLDFLFFACNIPELFVKAVPVVFKSLKKTMDVEACDFIFNHLLRMINSESTLHKSYAIQTISAMIDDFDKERQNIICDKYVKEFMLLDTTLEDNHFFACDIIAAVPKIIPILELCQQSDIIRTVINVFNKFESEKIIKLLLMCMLALFEKMNRLQKMNCIGIVLNYCQEPITQYSYARNYIKEFWLPTIFYKMNASMRAQEFSRIINMYYVTRSFGYFNGGMTHIFKLVALPQQLNFFDMWLEDVRCNNERSYEAFEIITPIILNKLDTIRKLAAFDCLIKIIEDKNEILSFPSSLTISKVFASFNAEEKTQLFSRMLLLFNCQFYGLRYAIEIVTYCFNALNEKQQIVVINKLINVIRNSGIKSNAECAMYALQEILKNEHDSMQTIGLLSIIVGLLDVEYATTREMAVKLVPKYLGMLPSISQKQLIDKILEFFSLENEYLKSYMIETISEVSGKMDETQHYLFFNLFRDYALNKKNSSLVIPTICCIFPKLNSEHQMLAFEIMFKLSNSDCNATRALKMIIDKLPLDYAQIEQLLNRILSICANDNYRNREAAFKLLPSIFRMLPNEIQQDDPYQNDQQNQSPKARIFNTLLLWIEMLNGSSESIKSLFEIYELLNEEQKLLVHNRVIALILDPSVQERNILFNSIHMIFDKMEPAIQREVFAALMSVYYNTSSLYELNLIIESPVLYCHAYTDGYSNYIENELFPLAELRKYRKTIEQALESKIVTNRDTLVSVSNPTITFCWDDTSILDKLQGLCLSDQSRVDPINNPFQLVRYRNKS